MLLPGDEESEFHAMGRGLMNTGSWPVSCDSAGFFGMLTSDSERTFETKETRNFLKE